MPWESDVMLTPLPEAGKTDELKGYVDETLASGARVENEGGGTVNQTFFYPAVVYPAYEKMKIYHKEQFGPVVPVTAFSSIEEPLNYIVESRYGQQLAIFCNDPEQISKLIDPLVNQVCRVNVNSQCQCGPDVFPFTGRKDSAEGTISVSDALRIFSIRTLVAAKETPPNQYLFTKIVRGRTSNFLSTDYIL
jgi:glyceraldehyde-3-phosphate dehydrogenase (NADP+)